MRSVFDPEFDLPPALNEACIAGDLDLTKETYQQAITADPPSQPAILFEVAIFSTKHRHVAILSFCFSQGLDIDLDSVNNPLIYAAYDSNSIEILCLFFDHGLDVNANQELGGTPLVSACYHGNVDLTRFLLDRGADPNNGCFAGDYEALVWAIISDETSVELIRVLLEGGVVVKGTGALIAAAEHGNCAVVELLVDMTEVDLEEVESYRAWNGSKDDMGTALYKAAAEGHVEIVNFLIAKGANTRYRDGLGRSVGDVAQENGHEVIVKAIRLWEENNAIYPNN